MVNRETAKQAGDRVMAELRNICDPKVKGAHDSDFVIVDGKAYIVYMANDVQPGESPQWPFVYDALSVVDISSGAVEYRTAFAASEMKYENAALPPGACFVPRILQKDATTLRCFFASEEPGTRQSQTWYIDFDLTRGEFDWNIYPAHIVTDQGEFPMQPQYLNAYAASRRVSREWNMHGVYCIDGFKQFDGKTYAVVNNFADRYNTWALLDDSMERFTILGDLFRPLEAQFSESAVHRLPDGTWMAISRQSSADHRYMFSTSPDGYDWSPHEHHPDVQSGGNSKPAFERFGSLYYLGWNDAAQCNGVHRSVYNLDVSRDGERWERQYRFESEQSFQYATFREYDGVIYLTVTQGGSSDRCKERIMFGVLENVE